MVGRCGGTEHRETVVDDQALEDRIEAVQRRMEAVERSIERVTAVIHDLLAEAQARRR
jgi:prefoldin subunit 5